MEEVAKLRMARSIRRFMRDEDIDPEETDVTELLEKLEEDDE